MSFGFEEAHDFCNAYCSDECEQSEPYEISQSVAQFEKNNNKKCK